MLDSPDSFMPKKSVNDRKLHKKRYSRAQKSKQQQMTEGRLEQLRGKFISKEEGCIDRYLIPQTHKETRFADL